MDFSKVRAALDAVRKQADTVRKVLDTIASSAMSIPILGGVILGYVRPVIVVVDGLDDAIDVLDDAIDNLVPKAAAPAP